jgi:hypothetical protein
MAVIGLHKLYFAFQFKFTLPLYIGRRDGTGIEDEGLYNSSLIRISCFLFFPERPHIRFNGQRSLRI